MGRIYVHVFIGVNDRMYMSCVCTVLKKTSEGIRLSLPSKIASFRYTLSGLLVQH
jgi:hypothetical protein